MVSQFHLSEATTGSLFLLFLSGTWTSTAAATLVARFGTVNTIVGLVLAATLGLIGCFSTNLGVTIAALLLLPPPFSHYIPQPQARLAKLQLQIELRLQVCIYFATILALLCLVGHPVIYFLILAGRA